MNNILRLAFELYGVELVLRNLFCQSWLGVVVGQ